METTIDRDLEIVELEVILNMDEPNCTNCHKEAAEWRGSCTGCGREFMWCQTCYQETEDDQTIGGVMWYCVQCDTDIDLKTFHKI